MARTEVKGSKAEYFFWNPVPTEKFSGILGTEKIKTADGSQDRFTLTDPASGEFAVLPSNMNLVEKLSSCQLGEHIEVVYRRELKIKGGKTFKLYGVFRLSPEEVRR